MMINSKTYLVTNNLEAAKVVLETSVLTKEIGFKSSMQNKIATMVSELSRNMLVHAGGGKIHINLIENENKRGIEITAIDHGPGIENLEKAMTENYSTKGSLGLGLPAIKRMADELEIKTNVGLGTTIIARKWLPYGKN